MPDTNTPTNDSVQKIISLDNLETYTGYVERKGIDITYAEYQQLTPAEKQGKTFYITDYDYDASADASDISYDNSDSGLDSTNVQDAIDTLANDSSTFVGTSAQWEALTTAQKKEYKYRLLTDDYTDASIGNLSALHTTDKSSVVGAVNEIVDLSSANITPLISFETGYQFRYLIRNNIAIVNINGQVLQNVSDGTVIGTLPFTVPFESVSSAGILNLNDGCRSARVFIHQNGNISINTDVSSGEYIQGSITVFKS